MATTGATTAQERDEWNIIYKVSLASLVALCGWLALEVINLKGSVAAINGNRFTARDGMAIHAELSDIREEFAKIPNEVPPQWFLTDVRELAVDVREVQQKINDHIHHE